MITDIVKDFRTDGSASSLVNSLADRSISSSVTCLETLSIEHKWTVESFPIHMELCSVGESLSSPVFGSHDGRYKFNLRLFPTGKDEECRSYVSLFLMIRECPGQKIRFKVNFFVDTTEGPKFCALNRHVVAINKGGIVTASKFFAVDFLKGRAPRFLPNDTLTVGVELAIFGDTVNSDVKKDELRDGCKVSECTLPEDFQRLLNNDLHTDCELVVGDTVLRAHKCVLSVRSPVFSAMFEHDMKEANSSQCIIEDLTVNAVRAVLHYIYTDSCPMIEEYAEEILQAADKYQVCRLKTQCEITLAKKIKVDNVCRSLKLADRHSAPLLRGRALTYLKEHQSEILNSDSWDALEAEDSALAAITLREILNSCNNNGGKAEKRGPVGLPDGCSSQKRGRFI